MRTLSIVALCLVAACATAASIDGRRSCILDRLEYRIELLRAQVGDELKELEKSGNEAAAEARQAAETKFDEVRDAMSKPIDKAQAKYDQCMSKASSETDRARCLLTTAGEIMLKAIPVVSKKASELVDAIEGIVKQFGIENEGDLDYVVEKGREFVKDVVKDVKECAAQ